MVYFPKHKPNMVPVLVRWTEDGQQKEKKMFIQKGTVVEVDGQEIGSKRKLVAETSSPKKAPIWNLGKEDAYILIGAGKASPDAGEVIQLDKNDMNKLSEEYYSGLLAHTSKSERLTNNTAARSGSGGRVHSTYYDNNKYTVEHSFNQKTHVSRSISIFMQDK